MQTPEEIKQKLLDVGVKEADIETVIAEVTDVAYQKIMLMYFSKLSPTHVEALKSLPEAKLREYIEKNTSAFSVVTEDEAKEVIEKTWKDYFKAHKK